MNKEIEELTEDLCDLMCKGLKCNVCDWYCEYSTMAEALYSAGYRKQRVGRWVLEYEHYGRMICSNCEGEAPITTKIYKGYRKYTEYVKKPFCPTCGAKMKGESDEQIH